MSIKLFLLGGLLFFLTGGISILPLKAGSSSVDPSSPKVLINEIAWMGTEHSFRDEWIELYNPSSSTIDLSGWTLTALDNSPEINLDQSIPPQGFYLLERTDDSTVPQKEGDLIYKGALNNKGEKLELRNKELQLVDSIDCSKGWIAGKNSTKQTMERKKKKGLPSSKQWQTSKNPGGTPKAQNSSGVVLSSPKVISTQSKDKVDFSTPKNQLQLFLIALLIGSGGGATVLLLKRFFHKNSL